MKKFLSVALAIALLTPNVAIASGEAVSDQNEPGKGYFGIDANPMFLNKFTFSGLNGREINSKREIVGVKNCKSLSDPACSNMNYFKADTLLPLCESAAELNCIDSLEAIDTEGKKLEVKTGEKFPKVRPKDFIGDIKANLPSGAQAPLVEIPGAAHAGGVKYIVIINPSGTIDKRTSVNAKFQGGMQGGIFAVKTISGSFRMGGQSENLPDYQSWGPNAESVGIGSGGDWDYGCIINDATTCAVPQEIPLGITFSLKIRFNFEVVNWFSGRLNSPDVAISPIATGGNMLTVTAKPTQVPMISRWIKKTALPSKLIDFYQNLPKPIGGTGDWKASQQSGDPSTWSLMRNMTSFDKAMMDEFLLWLPAIGDKSDYLPTLWTFRSIDFGKQTDSCLQSNSEVIGIVSTNATAYIDGPPQFNRESMSIEYKVAAPHLVPSGEVFKGSYDLQVLSASARCLYGFSNAPISATIEIVSESGEKQIAVTTVTERNGWLYLSAKGFTFSSPVVKVKLSQGGSGTSSKSGKNLGKEITITCAKGKKVQRIYGVKPKCPVGYKKK